MPSVGTNFAKKNYYMILYEKCLEHELYTECTTCIAFQPYKLIKIQLILYLFSYDSLWSFSIPYPLCTP